MSKSVFHDLLDSAEGSIATLESWHPETVDDQAVKKRIGKHLDRAVRDYRFLSELYEAGMLGHTGESPGQTEGP